MIIRKILVAFLAVTTLCISVPAPLLAGDKGKTEKTHKSRKERKQEKKQKKKWKKITHRANAYREPREKHVGENMFKRQTKREQKRRSKHHLKP